MTDSRNDDPTGATPGVTTEDEIALSAFIDAALTGADLVRLRARLEAEPALAERLAELSAVDAQLAQLAAESVSEARVAALRARLEPRLGAARAPRDRRPWLVAAASMAAGLTLYVLTVGDPVPRDAREGSGAVANVDAIGDVAPGALPVEEANRGAPDALDELDLAVALEYEVLADLDVIENLALLEALAAHDAGEKM